MIKHWRWQIARWFPRRCRIRWGDERCHNRVWREPYWRRGACEECMPF